METYYVDGPVIYTTHPLRLLVRNLQTYLACQYVVRITYVGSIEDHELMLYLVVTDKLDFRSKDSFNNKFKLLLTYEETVLLCDQINQIVQPIVNSLYAGQSTQQYSIIVKNRNLLFQGFIASNGQPMIKVTMMLVHENLKADVYMSLSKFQEFVSALNAIIRNWHSTLTNIYYQFDRIGKALIHIHKDLLQKIQSLESKIEQLTAQQTQYTEETSSCNTQHINVVNEPQVIQHKEPISTFVDQPVAETTDQNVKETNSVSDFVMEKLESITNQSKKASKDSQSMLIPIEYIDDIKDLEPYFNEYSITQLVEKYKEPLKKLLSKYGIPETMVENDADLLKVLMDIKMLLEGKPVSSMVGLMIQQALQEVS